MHTLVQNWPLLRLVFVALLLLPLCQVCAAQQPQVPRLEMAWKANLGAVYDEAAFRLAVCPDGSAYFTDAKGRLARVSPSGVIETDSSGNSQVVATVAVACDSSGQMHAVNRELLSVWRFDGGTLALSSSTSVRDAALTPSRLLIAGSNYVVLGTRRTTSAQYLAHRLLPSGRVVQSFVPIETSRFSGARRYSGKGDIAIDAATGRIAYFDPEGLSVRVFDEQGQMIKNLPASTGTQPQPAVPDDNSFSATVDRVIHAASLPHGLMAVQSVESVDSTGNKRKPAFFLRVLDSNSLNTLHRIPLAGLAGGILQGVSNDGKLVFLSATPGLGIQIAAYRLLR